MKPPTLHDTPWGKLWLYENDLIGQTLAGGNFWDGELLLPLFDEAAMPGKLVIDIGCFIGQNVVYCGRRGAEVLGAEVNPKLADIGKANVRENQLTHCEVVQCAAYDTRGFFGVGVGQWEAKFDPEDDGNLWLPEIGNVGGVAWAISSESAVVDAFGSLGGPLDPYVANLKTPVSLIKSDAQGADIRALRGLSQTIEKWRPLIVFEWDADLAGRYHATTYADFVELARWLRGLGYGIEESKTHRDNFICRVAAGGGA